MRRNTLAVGDIEVSFAEHGDGPPVVMLHGLAEDHRSWHRLQAGIVDHRTFACDLRGHGGSSLGAAAGTLAQLGGDLVGFLETVTGPARCLGYSLGGTVVLWAAAARPDLVVQVAVSGTSSVVGRAAVEFFAQRIATLGADRAQFERDLHADTAAQLVGPGADVAAVTARRIEAIGDGGGYVNAARAMMGVNAAPLTPTLAGIQCPVDVICGDRDVFCPRKAAQIILDAVSDGVYHEIEGAGHLMSIDQPDAYLQAFRAALARPPGRTPR